MTGQNINMVHMFSTGRIRYCALDGCRVICNDHDGSGVHGSLYNPSLRELDADKSWGGWCSSGSGLTWPSLTKAEQAFAQDWPDTYICELCDRVCSCNNPEPRFRTDSHEAEDEGLCSSCYFWLTVRISGRYFIANSTLYEYQAARKPRGNGMDMLGFGGSIFYNSSCT